MKTQKHAFIPLIVFYSFDPALNDYVLEKQMYAWNTDHVKEVTDRVMIEGKPQAQADRSNLIPYPIDKTMPLNKLYMTPTLEGAELFAKAFLQLITFPNERFCDVEIHQVRANNCGCYFKHTKLWDSKK